MGNKIEIKEKLEIGYPLITRCKLFQCVAEGETWFLEEPVCSRGTQGYRLDFGGLALLLTAVAPKSDDPREPPVLQV